MRVFASVLLAMAAVAGLGVARAGGQTFLCRPRAMMRAGVGYAIKNDNYAGVGECLSTSGPDPRSFQVAVSRAHKAGIQPVSFPEVFMGCTWGQCSPGSPLPATLASLHDLRTSWETSERAGGVWDAAYDLWFDPRPLRTGQATGAELMIWLNSRGTESDKGWPVVTVDGTRWHLVTWITQGHGKHWRYISFRKVTRVWQVHHLDLQPFFDIAERKGWIKPDWYLLNIEAGFEIWSDGTGLTTRSFSTNLNPTPMSYGGTDEAGGRLPTGSNQDPGQLDGSPG